MITNLIDPWVETLLELISIAAKHVTRRSFLLQNAGLDSYSLISESNGLNAEIKPKKK